MGTLVQESVGYTLGSMARVEGPLEPEHGLELGLRGLF